MDTDELLVTVAALGAVYYLWTRRGGGYGGGGDLRFITIADPHANRSGMLSRLGKTVNFVNQSNADFVVILGDISGEEGGSGCDLATYNSIKNELARLNKPYYILAGNHDLSQCLGTSSCNQGGNYSNAFGALQQIHNVVKNGKTYQIITVSQCDSWSIFNQADKNLPTLVFTHGPPNSALESVVKCAYDTYHRTQYGMMTELNKFNKLIGIYSGHIHEAAKIMVGNTIYTTEDSLTMSNRCSCVSGTCTDKVGYTKVLSDNIVKYTRLSYNSNFVDPFP